MAQQDVAGGKDVYSRLLARFRAAKLKANADGEGSSAEGATASSTPATAGQGGGGGGAGETMVVFVGDQEAGRTSLISAFLNPNRESDKTKPTVALEYMFARRSNSSSSGGGGGNYGGGNSNKEIAHIWDLGGGSQLSEVIRVPFTADCLGRIAFVIVLDLSKNVLVGLLYWLRYLRALIAERLDELRSLQNNRSSSIDRADAIAAAGKAKYAKDHVDRRAVNPLPVPVLIVGNKYDAFKDLDGVKRKLVSQALRFVAHYHGAGLIFTSTKEKALRDQYRHVVSNLLFRTPLKRLHETNGEKAIVVAAGMDSFQDIVVKGVGPPGVEAQELVSPSLSAISDRAMDVWKGHFDKFFGQATIIPGSGGGGGGTESKQGEEGAAGGGGDEALATEPLVDEARKGRDDALERYRKEAQRRQQLAAMERRQQQQPPSSQQSEGNGGGTGVASVANSLSISVSSGLGMSSSSTGSSSSSSGAAAPAKQPPLRRVDSSKRERSSAK